MFIASSGSLRVLLAKRSAVVRLSLALALVLPQSLGCGDENVLPTTVNPGPDFSVADVIFDANFFYCRVEPMLFAQSCGAGNGMGESSANCHHTQTSFKIVDYDPLFADNCAGGVVPQQGSPPNEAQQNYQRAQAKMNSDPEKAQLLIRPTAVANHPRKIFDMSSPEADIIEEWATKFTTQ